MLSFVESYPVPFCSSLARRTNHIFGVALFSERLSMQAHTFRNMCPYLQTGSCGETYCSNAIFVDRPIVPSTVSSWLRDSDKTAHVLLKFVMQSPLKRGMWCSWDCGSSWLACLDYSWLRRCPWNRSCIPFSTSYLRITRRATNRSISNGRKGFRRKTAYE